MTSLRRKPLNWEKICIQGRWASPHQPAGVQNHSFSKLFQENWSEQRNPPAGAGFCGRGMGSSWETVLVMCEALQKQTPNGFHSMQEAIRKTLKLRITIRIHIFSHHQTHDVNYPQLGAVSSTNLSSFTVQRGQTVSAKPPLSGWLKGGLNIFRPWQTKKAGSSSSRENHKRSATHYGKLWFLSFLPWDRPWQGLVGCSDLKGFPKTDRQRKAPRKEELM